MKSNSSFCALTVEASSSTKNAISNSVQVALIVLMVIVGAGVATIRRELRIACSRLSLQLDGDVLASSLTVTVVP
jgi:hypothetical protein